MSSGARRWRRQIEARTDQRLRELRQRGLWDGHPPVPIEHVAEHLLQLVVSFEPIDEPEGEVVLGCLRPHTREIVLNELRMDRFDVRGVLRFTMGHELGHADIFALADLATEQHVFDVDLRAGYTPRRRSSPKGDLSVLVSQLSAALRAASPGRRQRAYEAIREEERARIRDGADTAIEAAACNHYASTLLMPTDLLRAAVATINLQDRSALRGVASQFDVSFDALRIRLEFLGLIFGVDEHGHILLQNPALEAQTTLL